MIPQHQAARGQPGEWDVPPAGPGAAAFAGSGVGAAGAEELLENDGGFALCFAGGSLSSYKEGLLGSSTPGPRAWGFMWAVQKYLGVGATWGLSSICRANLLTNRATAGKQNTNQCSGMHFSSFSLNMEWLVGKEAPEAGRLRWGDTTPVPSVVLHRGTGDRRCPQHLQNQPVLICHVQGAMGVSLQHFAPTHRSSHRGLAPSPPS